MIKLFIILAVVALAVWLYRSGRTSPAGRLRNRGRETTMVRCAECQIYLPPASATRRGDLWYCRRHR